LHDTIFGTHSYIGHIVFSFLLNDKKKKTM
jgi:hypothetical protein